MRRAGTGLAALVLAPAVALSLSLAGCTGPEDEPRAVDTTGTATPDPSQSGSSEGTPGASPGSPTGSPDSGPSGGPSDDPAPAEPSTQLLDWQPLEGSDTDTVTDAGIATITVDQAQTQVRISGSAHDGALTAPKGFVFNDVISDGKYLVAVAQDRTEQQPGRASVVDLTSGKRRMIDGDSAVPTTNGGSWAIGGGQVFHATYGPRNRYCLASVTLSDLSSQIEWCAGKRAGFSQVLVTDTALSMLTFSGQPQCRTPATLQGGRAVPIVGVTRCKGWDGAVTPDGAVWSVVKNENRVEVGEFYASNERGYFDLGVGTTGTLTWCGDSAYFVQDAQRDVDKARLLRWTPNGTLEVVYESPGEGAAFLAEPRCAGDHLSISAFGEGGDEQVSAQVP